MKKRILAWTLGTLLLTATVCLSSCSDRSEYEKPNAQEFPFTTPGSDGLEFELNSDGNSYSVSDRGGCKDTDIVIPSTYKGKPVTRIGGRAFACMSFESITIPDSVTSIGRCAFHYCKSLTSITIPDSVTSIGEMAFYWCDSLTSVTIGNSVTSIGDEAFYWCDSLTSVTIGNSVTSIGDEAFYWCTSLTSITIPDGVKSIGDSAFEYCTSLQSITIPDSVTSIGEGAFHDTAYYNKNSNWAIGVLYIGNHLIKAESGRISYGYTIKTGTKCIADSAFIDCTSLQSITIPDSVISIGNQAFNGCTSLTGITIPDSVTSIGERAFEDCTSLTSITFNGTKKQWDAIDKGSGWDEETGKYIVHCINGILRK